MPLNWANCADGSCLGKSSGKMSRAPDFEWPLNLAQRLSASPLPSGRPLRFVYLSGALVEKNPNKSLWFLQEIRRNKGEAEKELAKLAVSRPTTLSCTIVRPAMVYPVGGAMEFIMLAAFSIRVDELAAAMIRTAMEEGTGGTGPVARTIENGELVNEGRHALQVSVSWRGERQTQS